jgi:hypothetical protein
MKINLKIIEGSQNFIKYTNNQIKFERVDNLYGNPLFLDYHKKIECFYLVVELNQKIVSYLPFTKRNNSILSHGGGTYGGFIQIDDLLTEELFEIENELLKILKLNGIDRLTIRFLPTLFWNDPSSLNSYFFSKMDSLFTEEEFYLPLDENLNSMDNLKFRRNHKRDVKKFLQNEFELISCNLEKDVLAFYEILENNLKKHKVKPTHTLDDLIWLFNSMNDKISISLIKSEKKYQAGLTLFDINSSTDYVMYGSMNYNSNSSGALKYLYWKVALNSYISGKKYLSLGINTKHDEPKNLPLEIFKLGLGAEVVDRHTKVLHLS